MADDVVKGQAKQLRGKFREWWGKLTDDDLDQAVGKKDQLVGALQKRYGWNKVQAEAEYDKRMKEYQTHEPRM